MTETGIEWADVVWNIVRGCTLESEGCRNCWAMRMAGRFKKIGQPYHGLVVQTAKGFRWTGKVDLIDDKLEEPLHVRKPKKIFVNSTSDLFQPKVPDDFIGEVFRTMTMADWHTYQILTKRAERLEEWFGSWAAARAMEYALEHGRDWPLRNVQLGVSVEDQPNANRRVPALLGTPAAVRWLSVEPLIGGVDLTRIACPVFNGPHTDECMVCQPIGKQVCERGFFNALPEGIDWIVVGCETGRRSLIRPMREAWVRKIRDDCQAHGVAFFYKQAKDERGKTISLPVLDGRQHAEFPGDRDRPF